MLGAYVVILALACLVLHAFVALPPRAEAEALASVWHGGVLLDRAVLRSPSDHDARLEALAKANGDRVILETVVGEGPIAEHLPLGLSLSLVPGRDGVKATLGSETAYVTPDDLLARQLYDRGQNVSDLGLAIGADDRQIVALLAERLHTTASRVATDAEIRRIRVERSTAGESVLPRVDGSTLTPEIVRTAAIEAARYLARGIKPDGHFRYTVDASTNREIPGYDWPRHAGATYFMAQAAELSHEPELAIAATRGASLLRDKALLSCGADRCVGVDDDIEVGSSALTIIALVEITRTGLDLTYRPLVADLARFLRKMQRADGEFMHTYDRGAGHAVDVQYLYFSGEAGLALARAHRLTADPADLDAAVRALAHLVGPAWHFFGNRYYFGEEHWTCQLMAELWDRSPNPSALDFCLRWQAYGRAMQYGPGETAFDADGAYGAGTLVTPRLTPVASRCEAAVATLAIARLAHRDPDELRALDGQLRRSLALLVRQQLRPGAAHLFADPSEVRGALPGSEVDWQLRIDYAQHAGSAMVRWLERTPN